jgi:hypothetical protein
VQNLNNVPVLSNYLRLSGRRNDLFWNFVYTLIGYYGRLSIFGSEDPAAIPDPSFPRDKIHKAFGKPAIDLFPLLKSMDTYEKALPSLPSLKSLFNQIINKLNYDVSPWSIFEANLKDQFSPIYNQIQGLVQSLSQLTSLNSFLKKESPLSKPDNNKPR